MSNKIQYLIYASIFLMLALLLTTHNYSIAIIVGFILISIYGLITHPIKVKLKKIDYCFILAASSYLIAFIPVAIAEGTTLRYFDAPLRFIACIPIYLLLRHFLENQSLNDKKLTISIEYGAIIGSIGAFILAIYQIFYKGMPRVDGFLYSINFGYLACSLAFLCLIFYKNSNHKMLNLVGFIAAIIATTLSLTRGAILTIPVLLIITLFFIYRQQLSIKKISTFFMLLISLSIISYHSSDNIKQRTDFTVYEMQQLAQGNTANASSSGGRLELWYSAIEAFKTNPVYGATYIDREHISQIGYESGQYTNKSVLVLRSHAHSQYFEILASAGIIGLIALVLYLIAPLIHYYQLLKRNEDNHYALAGLVFTLGICIFGLTEVLLQGNLISTYYAAMQAILFACAVSFKQAKRDTNV